MKVAMFKESTTYIFRSLCFSLVIALVLGTLSACKDDTFDDFDGRIPVGETSVYFEMNFEPLSEATLRSRGSAEVGDAIKSLNDFSILFYNMHDGAEGPYLRYDFTPEDIIACKKGEISLAIDEDVDRVDSDASNGHKAESKTTCVKFRLDGVPYGNYKIFAIANLGGKTSTTAEILDRMDISSPENLQYCSAEWDCNEILNNSQMTGFFTLDEQKSPGTGAQVTPVLINKPNQQIHSWLRRVVSKLTIDFDPTGMRNDVTVTIKKVTVRDIAKSCNLGAPNIIKSRDDLWDDANNPSIVYESGIVLTNKTEGYPRTPESADYPHTETAPALYFFENMQGEVPDKDTNGKYQDGDGDGIIDYPNANDRDHDDYCDHKDGLEFGTYVEVEGEYESSAQNNLGHGKIIYRFMIGKDTKSNCDAERNHHYKLTLRFLGNANEVDWHIEYNEAPGFYGPNPYYVSYLYNQSALYPIKISGTEIGPVTLSIIKNDWSPYNAQELTYYARPTKADDFSNDITFDENYIYNTEKNSSPNDYNHYAPWLGFLSLAEDLVHSNIGINLSLGGYPDYLYGYWTGNNTSQNTGDGVMVQRGRRTYKTNQVGSFYDGVYKANGDPYSGSDLGSYQVRKEPGSVTVNVPFFTRQKQLQKTTGFTGNNPYVAYERQAKIQVDYSTKETGPKSEVIDVYQVKRIVNPKGVWRRHDNATPFTATLMHQERESSSDFTPATSVGPWRAYVWRGNSGFITLDGKSEVRGGNGSVMEFTIGFKGTIRADQTRCAIIRVDYNNYSCHHLIFVRQGYAPIQMISGGCKWHTANIDGTSLDSDGNYVVTEAPTPTDEGSLFRYANLDKYIVASDNAFPSESFTRSNATPAQFDPGTDINPYFEKSKVHWNDIESASLIGSDNVGFPLVKINGKQCRVAGEADFNEINNKSEIDYGYGVLYTDNATETATSIDEAYGYCSSEGMTSGYGMRGAFVYNQSLSTQTLGGNNLFFPIGRAGYGHRKQQGEPWPGAGNRCYNSSNGVLQYASRAGWYDGGKNEYGTFGLGNQPKVPLFYDLFRSNGALYWLQKAEKRDKNSACVMDINYQTMDFSIADDGVSWGSASVVGLRNSSDACFLRLVESSAN